jgi:hypothetical protein
MSYGSGPCLPVREGPSAATHPTVPNGPPQIYKKLDGLPMQLGSRVSKVHTHISKAPDIRAIMDMQDVREATYLMPVRHVDWRVQYGYSAPLALLTTRKAPLQC